MKKFLSLLTALVLCMCLPGLTHPENYITDAADYTVWDGTSSTDWYYEADDPIYHISTAEDFAGFAELVNGGKDFAGKTVYLDNDIYLNDISNFDNWATKAPANKWTPIGRKITGTTSNKLYFFDGTFDGGGNTIYGLYQSNNDNLTAPFFYLDADGVIRNLNLDKACVQGHSEVGGIVGYNYGTIKNCSFGGECINAYTTTKTSYHAGGICARTVSGGFVYNCVNYGNVYGNSRASAAGICAYPLGGTVSGCRNYGNISADTANGIVGLYDDSNSTVKNCINYGDVTGVTYAGGIGNHVYSLTNCFNYGNIYAEEYAGGIGAYIGVNALSSTQTTSDIITAQVSKCGNYGSVTSKNGIAGGIAAAAFYSNISDCFNRSDITGKTYVGGICGSCNSKNVTVSDCYNRGNITGIRCGGLAGLVINCTASNFYSTGEMTSTNDTQELNALVGVIQANNGKITYTNCHYSDLIAKEGYTAASGVTEQSDDFMYEPDFADLLGDHFAYSAGEYPILAFETGIEPYDPSGTGTTTAVTTTTTTSTTTTTTTTTTDPDNDFVKGDANGDGEFSLADLVLFQRWLLGDDVKLHNWKALDFYEDEHLDSFDLTLMRKALISMS
ncbi:MAG: dockerin type I repeat-containing protein [Ruminococcus sp.]|nr:dockerin type I repeat-containing protein [Ruminococcus sp.]